MDTAHFMELLINGNTWRQAVIPLLAHSDQIATGLLRRDSGRQPLGLLADTLTVTDPMRTGADFPPLADWVAVAAPGDEALLDPHIWIQRLRPRFAQMLTILLMGIGSDRSGWRGWIVERGLVSPLAGLRVIGPGMVQAAAAPVHDLLAEGDESQWSRLRVATGERAFRKVRASKVAVVGCSRTGSLVAGMLAALGVQSLSLLDGDVLEAHNLDGNFLCTAADLGENKAVALGRRLSAYRPDLVVRALPRSLRTGSDEAALAGTDLLVTCVDADGARLRVAHWAREKLTPHLDIGSGVTRTPEGSRLLAADVRLLLPGAGCVRCVGGLGDEEQARYELHALPKALPRRPPEPWHARGRLGSLVSLNSLAVSTGVQSWLDLLDGSLAGSIWHRLCWRPGSGVEAQAGLVTRAADCDLCQGR